MTAEKRYRYMSRKTYSVSISGVNDATLKASDSGQCEIARFRFILLPETTKKLKEYMKQ